jgi:hypothetical protein
VGAEPSFWRSALLRMPRVSLAQLCTTSADSCVGSFVNNDAAVCADGALPFKPCCAACPDGRLGSGNCDGVLIG